MLNTQIYRDNATPHHEDPWQNHSLGIKSKLYRRRSRGVAQLLGQFSIHNSHALPHCLKIPHSIFRKLPTKAFIQPFQFKVLSHRFCRKKGEESRENKRGRGQQSGNFLYPNDSPPILILKILIIEWQEFLIILHTSSVAIVQKHKLIPGNRVHKRPDCLPENFKQKRRLEIDCPAKSFWVMILYNG